MPAPTATPKKRKQVQISEPLPTTGDSAPVKKQNIKRLNTPYKASSTTVDKPTKDVNTKQKVSKVQVEDHTFESLKLNPNTLKALQSCNIKEMNSLQKKILPALLRGKDILTVSDSQSGKTLSAIISAVELLISTQFKQRNHTGVLILSPTRESALLTYEMVKKITAHHSVTHGLILSNTNQPSEFQRLQRGIMIVVATPERFYDHMTTKHAQFYQNIFSVIIDDADKHCELNLQDTIESIINRFDPLRHTIMLSSSNLRSVQLLAKKTMRDPALVGHLSSISNKPQETTTTDNTTTTTDTSSIPPTENTLTVPDTIQHGYILVPHENKFNLLYTFIKRNISYNKHIIVYFNTNDEIIYFNALLNYLEFKCIDITTNIDDKQRSLKYFEYINSKSSVLLTTDNAIKGLSFPLPTWVIHYDCPIGAKQYATRLRQMKSKVQQQPTPETTPSTSLNQTTKSVLFLASQNEESFIDYISKYIKISTTSDISLDEYKLPPLINLHKEINNMVKTNFFLHRSSITAYFAYARCYKQFKDKEQSSEVYKYDYTDLNLTNIANGFCMEHPPAIKD